ncbi:WhiB family transcriptional regulator [Rhodococcus sp. NCIMB 12038]|uniref:WhiB family transcriptional regulator n=1 Tax=Rhodococcus sp. NCIMB 12038 TaxID=933800 RepID=UPI000B3CE675|nr:WhiB family transcriptional regulator [Rhodococcus sp. NCIMB 12038]OUS91485.1 WhiB family transcriptional regulator [Rhodococcus sp. NCIMB 12038]
MALSRPDTRSFTPLTDWWDWQKNAACRGMSSSIFFHPERERGPARERRIRVAKFICRHCPVIDSCRAHALTVVEPYGIWGGLSESELREATDQHY